MSPGLNPVGARIGSDKARSLPGCVHFEPDDGTPATSERWVNDSTERVARPAERRIVEGAWQAASGRRSVARPPA